MIWMDDVPDAELEALHGQCQDNCLVLLLGNPQLAPMTIDPTWLEPRSRAVARSLFVVLVLTHSN